MSICRGKTASTQASPSIVVVEQHQHALEHIHHMLRKRKQFTPWTMVHFDAHPDMACSDTIPAKLFFSPRMSLGNCNDDEEEKTLYDYLDETSTGIAEWILPLALAAKLQRIVWIKPTFSHQLTLGETAFHVGVLSSDDQQLPVNSFLDLDDDAVLRVDYAHPYYLDDDHVVGTFEHNERPPKKLQLPQKLNLHVKHADNDNATAGSSTENASPWMLDICLDYFVCRNPFVHDIEVLNADFAQLILSLSKECLQIAASKCQDYRSKRSDFHEAFESLLCNKETDKICRYLEQSKDSRVASIVDILLNDPHADKLAAMTMEALPHIAMPHETNLPSAPEVEERITGAVREIRAHNHNTPPFLVTVARSTNDGFCPLSVVESIQERLLNYLDEIYGSSHDSSDDSCKPSKLRVVKDYGETEGSTLD